MSYVNARCSRSRWRYWPQTSTAVSWVLHHWLIPSAIHWNLAIVILCLPVGLFACGPEVASSSRTSTEGLFHRGAVWLCVWSMLAPPQVEITKFVSRFTIIIESLNRSFWEARWKYRMVQKEAMCNIKNMQYFPHTLVQAFSCNFIRDEDKISSSWLAHHSKLIL